MDVERENEQRQTYQKLQHAFYVGPFCPVADRRRTDQDERGAGEKLSGKDADREDERLDSPSAKDGERRREPQRAGSGDDRIRDEVERFGRHEALALLPGEPCDAVVHERRRKQQDDHGRDQA